MNHLEGRQIVFIDTCAIITLAFLLSKLLPIDLYNYKKRIGKPEHNDQTLFSYVLRHCHLKNPLKDFVLKQRTHQYVYLSIQLAQSSSCLFNTKLKYTKQYSAL